jgi:hypothetical protein
MKNRALYFFGLLMLLIIVGSYPAYASTPASKSTGKIDAAVTQIPAEKTEAGMEKKSEYPLPFPGILPDHPLYFLKRFRDQLMETLIVDPVSKAKFYILMADKHIQMVLLLVEKGSIALGSGMATKAEMYLSQAYERLQSLKTSEKELPGYMVEHLVNASSKHVEILIGLSGKTGDAGITSALGAAKNVLFQANSLK